MHRADLRGGSPLLLWELGGFMGSFIPSSSPPLRSPSSVSPCPITSSICSSIRPSSVSCSPWQFQALGIQQAEKKEHELCTLLYGMQCLLRSWGCLHTSSSSTPPTLLLWSTWQIAHRKLNMKTSASFQSRKKAWFLQITNL